MNMVDVYYQLVKAGRRAIDQVPEHEGIRQAVQEKLSQESQSATQGTEP